MSIVILACERLANALKLVGNNCNQLTENNIGSQTVKQTKKYKTACEIATLNHQTQEELYSQLNQLGFYWESKKQRWERNDQLADKPSEVIRVRVWADTKKVEQAAAAVVEAMEADYGLKLLERSAPYSCRPPKQNDSRIYLTFVEVDEEI